MSAPVVHLAPVPATVEGFVDFCLRKGIEVKPTMLEWLPDAIRRGNARAEEYHRSRMANLAKEGNPS